MEEIRDRISFKRWRLYETACQILAEVESRIDWRKLYDAGAELAELLSWGLFLEEAVPGVAQRMRSVVAEPEPAGCRSELSPAELEDYLFWGTRQIRDGLQQSLSILSREMVDLVTHGTREPADGAARDKRRSLGVPIAEVAGKLRSHLRKLTAFLVAGDLWDADDLELVLFPQKRRELEASLSLKQRLVETMEGFQGSDTRLPISEVIQLWRRGEVLGQAALADVDALIGGLASMLEHPNGMALYADSYYRLSDWSRHLGRCSEGLRRQLGDEKVEDTLIKEIAAILDSEILAQVLGDESLRRLDLPRDLGEILSSITERNLDRLELSKAQQSRLVELRSSLETALASASPPMLAAGDEELLLSAAARIRGKRLVDDLRAGGRLPESMASLERLQPLVIGAEEGLQDYLMLLYGQIQYRDLHLLEEERKELSLAEKRLVLSELEYRLSRLRRSEVYVDFKTVRNCVAERVVVPAEEWAGLLRFLDILQKIVTPRLERIGSFAEFDWIEDTAARLTEACDELTALAGPPRVAQHEAMMPSLDAVASVLAELRSIRIVIAPPQTEAEIEDFLNMMG